MAQTSKAKAQTMRAVALDKFGGPEALKIQELPIPEIESQEVLIQVEAAGQDSVACDIACAARSLLTELRPLASITMPI